MEEEKGLLYNTNDGQGKEKQDSTPMPRKSYDLSQVLRVRQWFCEFCCTDVHR